MVLEMLYENELDQVGTPWPVGRPADCDSPPTVALRRTGPASPAVAAHLPSRSRVRAARKEGWNSNGPTEAPLFISKNDRPAGAGVCESGKGAERPTPSQPADASLPSDLA